MNLVGSARDDDMNGVTNSPRLPDSKTDSVDERPCYDPAKHQTYSPVTLCTADVVACMSSAVLFIKAFNISISVFRKAQNSDMTLQNQTLKTCRLKFRIPLYTKQGKHTSGDFTFRVNLIHQSCTRSNFVRFRPGNPSQIFQGDFPRYYKLNTFVAMLNIFNMH